ncbi:alginate export family protein [Flavihumibacter solisilvae]|uniref:Alginate export domain-containing protein n=1 Tax=Flavihumibacter solisilvae TaxID=1349421 RepID=A0A0C1LH94_9BACT|nr:alginate export family protein [Flavihumibacter solisilvae]KIC94683.1 hypothetical protein OI18_11030 [Flavihumibacter solisilvae]
MNTRNPTCSCCFFIWITCTLILEYSICTAQSLPAFKPIRYEEDYSFLRTDSGSTWYQKIKYVPLSKAGNVYLSIGGDLRTRFTVARNEKWGDAPISKDTYWVNRALLHTDLRIGARFRFFLQLQSGFVYGRNDQVTVLPVEHNELEVHQLFTDVSLLKDPERLILRVGRQEMVCGSLRLVAARDYPNVRRSFDGARLLFRKNAWQSSVFYHRVVEDKKWAFDDGVLTPGIEFWGWHNKISDLPFLQNIELYYLAMDKKQSQWNDVKGHEQRTTVGTRIFGKGKKWTYDFEGLYQFGHIADNRIRGAWSVSSNLYVMPGAQKHALKLGLKTELISGDRKPGDGSVQSLNPFFPNGGYFGLPGLIGPTNLFDLHPSIAIKPGKKITVGADYDIFWRLSNGDGIYGPAPNLLYPAGGSDKSFIGHQLGVDLNYDPNAYLNFLVNPYWFWPGSFLDEKSSGKTIFLIYLVAQVRF